MERYYFLRQVNHRENVLWLDLKNGGDAMLTIMCIFLAIFAIAKMASGSSSGMFFGALLLVIVLGILQAM